MQKDCLEYGIPVSFHHFGTWLTAYAASLVLSLFYAPEMLGILSIALKIILPASMLIDAPGNALTPIYFKLRNEGEFIQKK